jgi:PAS domain S-box-containing protein
MKEPISTKHLEAEFLKTSEILKKLIITGDDTYYFAELETGLIIDVNDNFIPLFGYDRDEIIGKTSLELGLYYNSDDRARMVSELKSRGFVKNMELQGRRKNGNIFTLLISVNIVQLEKPYIVGVIRDITEQKFKEEALQESEEKYRSLIEKLNEAVLIVQDEVFIFANPKAYELIGISDADFSRKPFIDLVWPEDREMVATNYMRRIAGDIFTDSYDFRIIGTKDRPLWVFMSVALIQYNGRSATLLMITDITERKNAEKALKDSQSLISAIVDSTTDMIWSVDPENFGLLTFNLGLSNYFLKQRGMRIKVGMCPEVLFPTEEFVNKWREFYQNTLKEGPYVVEYDTFAGSKTLQLTFNLLKRDDKVFAISIFGKDITEQKLADKMMELNSQRVNAKLQLNQMLNATLKEITDFTLEAAVILTSSKIGYLAFLNDDESVLTMHSWSKSAMAECAIADKTFIYPVVTTGLWGEAVRQRRPVITNDYTAVNPLKRGYPQGHVVVIRHMNIPVFVNNRIILVAGVGNKDENYNDNDANELTLLMESMWRLIERKRSEEALKKSYKKIEKTLEETIKTLASIVEIRDPYTSGHQQRVTQIATSIASELGLEEDRVSAISTAATVHDIGKINIPASILSKPGKISELEYEMIKTHPETGYDMLKNIDFSWPIAKIVLQHHERINGTGYPKGLKGKNIMLEAKIIAVADVVEAMASHRPYRPTLGIDQALKEIGQNKAILYDSKVVDACIKLFRQDKFEL